MPCGYNLQAIIADAAKNRRYTVKDPESGEVLAGLKSVPSNNACLLRLSLDRRLTGLAVGEFTIGTRNGERYMIERVK